MDKYDKLFISTTQECWCQYFSKYLSKKFQGFYEICYYYVTGLFNDKGWLLYHNVTVYT